MDDSSEECSGGSVICLYQVFRTFHLSGSSCSGESWRCFKPEALAERQMDGCTDLSILHQTVSNEHLR